MFSAEISRELKFNGLGLVSHSNKLSGTSILTHTHGHEEELVCFSAFKLVVLFYAWLNCFLCFTPIITNYRAK